jgi:hypothetical protein
MIDQATSLNQPTKEQADYALKLRHKLAMESIGLIRTCLHVQRPVFDAMLDLERDGLGGIVDRGMRETMLHSKSFNLQLRMVKLCVAFLNDLDGLADEVVALVEKEKLNG